jgi:hypothetical protein
MMRHIYNNNFRQQYVGNELRHLETIVKFYKQKHRQVIGKMQEDKWGEIKQPVSNMKDLQMESFIAIRTKHWWIIQVKTKDYLTRLQKRHFIGIKR